AGRGRRVTASSPRGLPGPRAYRPPALEVVGAAGRAGGLPRLPAPHPQVLAGVELDLVAVVVGAAAVLHRRARRVDDVGLERDAYGHDVEHHGRVLVEVPVVDVAHGLDGAGVREGEGGGAGGLVVVGLVLVGVLVAVDVEAHVRGAALVRDAHVDDAGV